MSILSIFNIVTAIIIIVIFGYAYKLYKKSKECSQEVSAKEEKNVVQADMELIEKETLEEKSKRLGTVKNLLNEYEKVIDNTIIDKKQNQKLTPAEIIEKYGIVPDNTITDEKELEGEFEEVNS